MLPFFFSLIFFSFFTYLKLRTCIKLFMIYIVDYPILISFFSEIIFFSVPFTDTVNIIVEGLFVFLGLIGWLVVFLF